jgi:4-hydroxybenzoate polyprenyltransferase
VSRTGAAPAPLEMPPAWLSLVRAFHPFPSALVSAITVGIALFAIEDPGGATVAMLGVGMLCYQFCIGLVNDIADAEDDARTKPWKAIPRGVLPRGVAMGLAIAVGAAGLVVTAGLPPVAWFVGLAGLLCGLAYDVRLKRTAFSWLPLSIAMPLVPAWVFTAFRAWDHLLWWTFPLGAALGLAVHLANQLPDIADEEDSGGATHRLGPRASRRLMLAAFGFAGALSSGLLLATGEGVRAAIVVVATVVAIALIPRATALFGRDGLFGVLAAATGVIAVVFLSAVRG